VRNLLIREAIYEKRYITREVLERLKEKFNCKECSDQDFLKWYKRAFLTGYEKAIIILEPDGTRTEVKVYP